MIPRFLGFVTVLALATCAQASVVFSGDLRNGTGTVTITAPITYTATGTLSNNGVFIMVLDNVVTYDGSFSAMNIVPVLQVNKNGSPLAQSTTNSTIFDNHPGGFGALTAGDGYFRCDAPTGLSPGDTITLLAGTYAFPIGNSNFNPQYNGLTFSGQTFLQNDSTGAVLSGSVSAVPEPGTLGVVGLTLTAILVRRRKRTTC